MNKKGYRWYASGDVNAFFGLMLDNIAGLVLAVSMLASIFRFPVDFALRYMVPGTAIGVLVGDLLYFVLAFSLSKRAGRTDITAMPLGLDTPSTIGMVLFVIGPTYEAAKQAAIASGVETSVAMESAATHAWHIAICAIVFTGVIKAVLAFGSNWIRRVFPRAGLLGSLAAIALVLIAFTQLPKLAANPVVGFASLAIVLATLVARGRLPFHLPGALGAVVTGCLAWLLFSSLDPLFETQLIPAAEGPALEVVWFPIEWLTVFRFEWVSAFPESLNSLPYVIPFALATVIGGIDCTESAAAAGDPFQARSIIGIEAIATLVAGLCGGVVQTTPYIGHPAYKAMGGRAAYTLATALFVGGAGVVGYFSLLFRWIPEAAVLPILIFIGIEITAQSFQATPRRHYAALALACLPAMAKLIMIYLGQFLVWIDFEQVEKIDPGAAGNLRGLVLHLSVLAGGFILTSLIWASAMARLIDRKFFNASLYFAIAGILVLFGVIHSPLDGDKMFLPWQLPSFVGETQLIVYRFAMAYLVMAGLMYGLGWVMPASEPSKGPEAIAPEELE